MNARNLTVGGILLTMLSLWGSRVTGLVSDEQLLNALYLIVQIAVLGSVVLTFAAISYGVSWSATQAYKVLYLSPSAWGTPKGKRQIYRFAIWSAGLAMLSCGTFFLLAEDLTTRDKVVVSVFWVMLCALVALSSPHLWRFAFENLLPRLRRWARGRERGENEAMDRPSEVPRE
jgi:hypothetical protein